MFPLLINFVLILTVGVGMYTSFFTRAAELRCLSMAMLFAFVMTGGINAIIARLGKKRRNRVGREKKEGGGEEDEREEQEQRERERRKKGLLLFSVSFVTRLAVYVPMELLSRPDHSHSSHHRRHSSHLFHRHPSRLRCVSSLDHQSSYLLGVISTRSIFSSSYRSLGISWSSLGFSL